MDGSHPPSTLRPESAGDSLRRREAALRDDARAEAEVIMAELELLRARCADLATVASLPPGPQNALRLIAQHLAADLANLEAIQARSTR